MTTFTDYIQERYLEYADTYYSQNKGVDSYDTEYGTVRTQEWLISYKDWYRWTLTRSLFVEYLTDYMKQENHIYHIQEILMQDMEISDVEIERYTW
jgi:hypothetical protein